MFGEDFNVAVEQCVEVELPAAFEYVSSISDVQASLEGLVGVNREIAASLESIDPELIDERYPVASYTLLPSGTNEEIALESITEGFIKGLGKILMSLFTLVGKFLGSIIEWLAKILGYVESSSTTSSAAVGAANVILKVNEEAENNEKVSEVLDSSEEAVNASKLTALETVAWFEGKLNADRAALLNGVIRNLKKPMVNAGSFPGMAKKADWDELSERILEEYKQPWKDLRNAIEDLHKFAVGSFGVKVKALPKEDFATMEYRVALQELYEHLKLMKNSDRNTPSVGVKETNLKVMENVKNSPVLVSVDQVKELQKALDEVKAKKDKSELTEDFTVEATANGNKIKERMALYTARVTETARVQAITVKIIGLIVLFIDESYKRLSKEWKVVAKQVEKAAKEKPEDDSGDKDSKDE